MDPPRNDFNGQGLPPHRRQGQEQEQPQQLSGFNFHQLRNHLAALGGMDRTRVMQLQDEMLIRQELDRQRRVLNERNELMQKLVEGKYTQLTRQGNDNNLHRPPALNLQPSGNHMFLSAEDQIHLQRQAVQQQEQQRHQNAVQQALQQRQQDLHRRELRQQQQQLQSLQQSQFRNLLLSSRIDNNSPQQNGGGSIDSVCEPPSQLLNVQEKKRKRATSSGSIGAKINANAHKPAGTNKKGSKKKRTEKGESKAAKEKQKKRSMNGTDLGIQDKSGVEKIIESAETSTSASASTSIQDQRDTMNGDTNFIEIKEADDVAVNQNEPNEYLESGKSIIEQQPDWETTEDKPFSRDNNLDALIQAAEESNSNSNNATEDPEEGKESNADSNSYSDTIHGMEMLLAAVNPANGGFSDEEAVDLMKCLKEITAQDPTAAAYFGIPDLEEVEISPGYFTAVPKLPEEPEFDEAEAKRLAAEKALLNGDDSGLSESMRPEEVNRDVKVPTFLDNSKKETKLTYDVQTVDSWFPTSTLIRRERRSQGLSNDDREVQLGSTKTEPISISDEMNKRLRNSLEPGVLEKLPHCKVHYQAYVNQYGKLPREPVFCCQVTETYCKSPMVCCSRCSTWRHVECGGHFTHYSPNSAEESFTPVCDRCHKEEMLLKHYPQALKRMARQRSIQLRTVHAVTAIMRNSAYAKHGGTYKWPLGSVPLFHIGSHTKSIHLRHERAEKQWKEMAAKLNSISNSKSSRAKTRTRDFERLMVNLEDAEGQTDRHNMTLFLEWDTAREYPVGFENPCLNFFDPAEDDQKEQQFNFDCEDDEEEEEEMNGTVAGKSLAATAAVATTPSMEEEEEKNNNEQSNNTLSPTATGVSTASNTINEHANTHTNKTTLYHGNINDITNDESRGGRIIARSARTFQNSPKRKNKKLHLHCIRSGCKKKPRFDSSFCSDACGVLTMEEDLLCSLQYAGEMHPYQLRP